MTLLILAGFGALFAGGFYWARQLEQRRMLALRAVAERRGWTYHPRPSLHDVPGLQATELASTGRGHRLRHLLTGTRGDRQLSVFDLTYATGGGKSSQTWVQTVVHVRTPGLNVPGFVLRPEHVFHKIAGMFGYQDIDIPSDPDFSGRYLLRGRDEAGIAALFGSEVRDFFARNEMSCAEAEGEDLFYWRTSRTLTPDQVEAQADLAVDLANRLIASGVARVGL